MTTSSVPALSRVLLILVLPTALVVGLLYVAGKMIEVRPPPRPSITAYGEAKLQAKPDMAHVTLGVQTGRQPRADQAMDQLSKSMDVLVQELRRLGIADKDIQTQDLMLSPAYDYVNGTQVSKGFEASENVVATIRDIGKVGNIIAGATRVGANQVSGIQLLLSDPTQLHRQARTEAILHAKADAQQLAAELGGRLGNIVEYHEESSSPSEPPMLLGKGMGGGGAVPVPTGAQEVTVGVSLSYEIHY